MIRVFLSLYSLAVVAVAFTAGQRGVKFTEPPLQFVPDMKDQPKLITQHRSAAFRDGSGDHSLIVGTIPLGYSSPGAYFQTGVNSLSDRSVFSNQFDYLSTGLIGSHYGSGFPVPISKGVLDRGQDRYNIHCSVCHDRRGSGNGVAKRMGLVTVASLIDDRIKAQPEGQIFNTVTHGKNTMGAYGTVLSVDDRWAIVAYVRFLQAASGGGLSGPSGSGAVIPTN
jgi:hypothetical protein